jgi:cystathionine gamma-synthase
MTKASHDHDLHSHFETLAIHAGQAADPTTGAVVPPIYQVSTYVQREVDAQGEWFYSRRDNPSRHAVEETLAALEGGAWALTYASGMAAVQNTMYLLDPGDHIILSDNAYGGTHRIMSEVFPRYGITHSLVDLSNLDAVAAAMTERTRLVWVETPTNPYLKIADIHGISALIGDRPTLLGVDNTFASPYLQNPLALGADLVMHSTTKYLGGHSDMLGGALIGSDLGLWERLKMHQALCGAIPGPFDCWLLSRGIKTLAVRMERHSASAMTVAAMLSEHPAVSKVYFPGLPEHPNHDVARRQMRAFSGMVSFQIDGDLDAMKAFASGLRTFQLAVSLGGVESLVEVPAFMTHAGVRGTSAEIDEKLVRLSIGLEHVEDLIADLDHALARVPVKAGAASR